MIKPPFGAWLCALLLAGAPADAAQINFGPATAVGGISQIGPVVAQSYSLSVSATSSPQSLSASFVAYPHLTVYNSGSVTAYLANGSPATTSGIVLPAGAIKCIDAAGLSTLSAITASSTTTLLIDQANACVPFSAASSGGGGGGSTTQTSAALGAFAAGFSPDIGNSSAVSAWTGSGTPSLLSVAMATYNASKSALPAQFALGVDIGAIELGYWGGATLAAGTAWGTAPSGIVGNVNADVLILPPTPLGTTNGWSPLIENALTTTVKAIKGSAGQLGMLQCYNPNATQAYVQVFNVVSGSVTLGTTAPTLSIPIAPTSTGGYALSNPGINFSTAISLAAATTATGLTAPGSNLDCNVAYN